MNHDPVDDSILIYLVDDSRFDRLKVKRSLEKFANLRVDMKEFTTSALLLEQLKDSLPDCIVADIHLADRDAFDLLAELKCSETKMLPCPTVLITGSSTSNLGLRALAEGAHDYINKERLGEPTLWHSVTYAISRFNLQRDLSNRARELEELNRELERKNRVKTEFVANATHELRTPVSAISGLVQILKEHEHTAEVTDMIESINTCCDALLTSVDDIIDISKIEAGEFVSTPTSQCLEETVGSAIIPLRPLAEQKGLKLDYEVPDLGGDIYGDHRRVRQLITNLTGNAIKFTKEGSISVLVKLPEKPIGREAVLIRFEISDTGPGLPKSQLERLFERHYRGAHSTTATGSGLGLTVAAQIVTSLGGEIGAFNRQDQGATFWFDLPFKRRRSHSGRSGPNSSVTRWQGFLKPPKVLLAEDNGMLRRILAKQLLDRGADVKDVEDGNAAVEVARDEDFDLLIFDARMPEMSGFEACRTIRDFEGYKDKPIVILTADSLITSSECERWKVTELLVKPMSPSLLERTLVNHLPHLVNVESS